MRSFCPTPSKSVCCPNAAEQLHNNRGFLARNATAGLYLAGDKSLHSTCGEKVRSPKLLQRKNTAILHLFSTSIFQYGFIFVQLCDVKTKSSRNHTIYSLEKIHLLTGLTQNPEKPCEERPKSLKKPCCSPICVTPVTNRTYAKPREAV